MKKEKQIYGLIGYPVKHSLSPAMHNAAFKALGIGAYYELFEVKPEELDNFFKDIYQKQICGLNVTIPHKEKVLKYINTDLPSEVKLIGAANTIKIENNTRKISCANTDGLGFMRHLEEMDFSVEDKKVAILGAGGAAKAICVQIATRNPKEIAIFDIDEKKAADLVSRIKKHFPKSNINLAHSIEELNISKTGLLINATPVGMKDSDPCLVSKDLLHPQLFVYDLIYNPQETKLLKSAKEKSCGYSNGLGMLLHQGMLSFGIWTGKPAPKDLMQKALLEVF